METTEKIIISRTNFEENMEVGGKATHLFHLFRLGLNVPEFIVLPQAFLQTQIHKNHHLAKDREELDVSFPSLIIPENVINQVIDALPHSAYYAVRSSAQDEDNTEFSFAGQYKSFLFVTKQNLAEKIVQVWESAFAPGINEYRKMHHLSDVSGLSVIVQVMIPADAAGVAFGLNPVNNNGDEKIINAVFGVGEGLVSGEYDADTFVVSKNNIDFKPAKKLTKLVLNQSTKAGIKTIPVPEEEQLLPALNEKHIYELVQVLDKLYEVFGQPQDIEFAVYNDELFILQTRPITTTLEKQSDKTNYTVWDNSNIIESYPGVTTPLTFSFIKNSYEQAYKLFCSYLGVSEKVIKENEHVFKNTLGLLQGRVYYNLKSWYHMLAMLPGYSINARFMEKMMGVTEQFDIPESYKLSTTKAFISISKMLLNMYRRFLGLPEKRKTFVQLTNTVIDEYKQINFEEKTVPELLVLYKKFEKTLLQEWKAPLLNDFYAMIYYGMLQKRCIKYQVSDNPNIHNDLLCGSSDIISTEPIHRSITMATFISKDEALRKIFTENDGQEIWHHLQTAEDEKSRKLKKEIEDYLFDFGERCMGELKLETISYSQEPWRFVHVLKAYVETGINAASVSDQVEDTIRKKAESEVAASLKNKPWKRYQLKKTLNKTRELVSARENLRYQRTRAFGIVRKIFFHIGQRLYSNGLLNEARDVFYLTIEDIISFAEGTSVDQDIKNLALLRKKNFEAYATQPAPANRLTTYGMVYHQNNFFEEEKPENLKGDLQGIGCCPGRIKGKVVVVKDPQNISSLNGEILVASSTDPGWVILFAGAAGVITERGSVLSHSAIVCREIGKPCIVGIPGLLDNLQSGDEVEMDGSTGAVKIINRHDR